MPFLVVKNPVLSKNGKNLNESFWTSMLAELKIMKLRPQSQKIAKIFVLVEYRAMSSILLSAVGKRGQNWKKWVFSILGTYLGLVQ